ncbi:unnamed protein product [Soboliphyme baturini]|uniref:Tubulin-specific chaperone cofactor E-like protein n=1 Tax=Soboliphyme baturini TaxID=241478 RepID=A0A183ICP8_9BILA|nr:unnamed protein product [Soboliphyme baturini]
MVLAILRSMVALKQCNLSFNPLVQPWQTNCHVEPFLKLTDLALNNTNIQWDALMNLLKACPNLQELHLSLNDFSMKPEPQSGDDDSTSSQPCFDSVRILAIDQCCMTHWERVTAVCRYFPNLQGLIASGNEVAEFGSSESIKRQFRMLESLNVNHWRINDWDSLNVFRVFPSLRSLRLKSIPLFENLDDKQRIRLAIACLPSIVVLNGTNVEDDRREDSERYFIRHFLDVPAKPERYYELVAIHGHLQPLLDIDLSPKLTADVMVVYEDTNKKELVEVTALGYFSSDLYHLLTEQGPKTGYRA